MRTPDRNTVDETEIQALEQREAEAMRAADVSTLQTLWAEDLIVNSTANLIAGKQILLEMINSGRLRLRTYERRPVRITTFGDLAISTGNEVSQLVADPREYKLFVSYMNVWGKRDGEWRLVARHVGMITREMIARERPGKPQPSQ
jgi:ketosteroid isomerase-like protein